MPGIVQQPVAQMTAQPATVVQLKQAHKEQGIFAQFAAAMKGKDQALKVAVLKDLESVASGKVTPDVAPYLVSILKDVISKCSDMKGGVNKAAEAAAAAIVRSVEPNAIKAILPTLAERIGNNASKWSEKRTAINLLDILAVTAPTQLPTQLATFYQPLVDAMWDTKPEVKKAAKATMEKVCSLIDNADIAPKIPLLIESMAKPTNIPNTVHEFSSVVFVKSVTTPVLALMTPILERGLKGSEPTEIKRKCAKIAHNMCSVVTDPQDAALFVPKLHDAVRRSAETLADIDARKVTDSALEKLEEVGKFKDGKFPPVVRAGDLDYVLALLKEIVASKNIDHAFEPVLVYVAGLAAQLVDDKNAEIVDWNKAAVNYLAPFVMSSEEAKEVAETFRKRAASALTEDSDDEEEEEGEDLCRIKAFTLAYPTRLLLKDSPFIAKRGRRYILLGGNGTGKSTLVRKMAEGTVDNFPPPEEMKCVLVAVENVNSADPELSVIEFVAKDSPNATREEIVAELKKVDFTDQYINGILGALSGGWKMKLALASAMLQKADILLLDEPTNHLDKYNVDWLSNFLMAQKSVSSLIISHDAKFMETVGQGIFHYENLKLVKYNVSLYEFAKLNPKTHSYLKLEDSLDAWKFPTPTLLDGIKHANTPFIKVKNMSFQYPGTSAPQLRDIKFQCSRTSRIAIVGRNGAGKSTLVKVLIGDLEPTPESEVIKHENAIISYMSQQAFELLGQHGNKTAYEYLEWRFSSGEDREAAIRGGLKDTSNYKENHDKIFDWDKDQTKRKVIGIVGRVSSKRTFIYECETLVGHNVGQKGLEKWIPQQSSTDNIRLPREDLVGSHKEMKEAFDLKLIRDGPNYRPITRSALERHCADVGMDAELTNHSHISGMSGGQKVRMLLAAATWLRPHLIVLDEPSNFLDRDSLGALVKALRIYEGGVVVISHSQEFLENVSTDERKTETWLVDNGQMTPSDTNWESKGEKLNTGAEGDVTITDAMGNVEKKKKMVKPDRKAEMRMKKAKKAAEKAGEYFDEQEWYQNNL